MVEYFKQVAHLTNPSKILLDFEAAAINAFKQDFRNAQIYGCFFILARAYKEKFVP
jgi:hypothetical protein